MAEIKAELHLATIGDINNTPNGLLTFIVEVPYFVWTELLTHKRFARNASSARAEKTDKHISHGFYMPNKFYQQGNGMSSSDELIQNQLSAGELYREAWDYCSDVAKQLERMGVAKEQANRVLPTIKMIRGIVTGTLDAWNSFLYLRYNKNADKAMQELAGQIKNIIEDSNFSWNVSKYHIPFSDNDSEHITDPIIAGARIARISYGQSGISKNDMDLGQRLLTNGHLSPFEHIAEFKRLPMPSCLASKYGDFDSKHRGWENYRSVYEFVKGNK